MSSSHHKLVKDWTFVREQLIGLPASAHNTSSLTRSLKSSSIWRADRKNIQILDKFKWFRSRLTVVLYNLISITIFSTNLKNPHSRQSPPWESWVWWIGSALAWTSWPLGLPGACSRWWLVEVAQSLLRNYIRNTLIASSRWRLVKIAQCGHVKQFLQNNYANDRHTLSL